ncbi:MAG: hypothetical protein B7X07_03695 [Actinobacteria bacterium 21-64-8]|nr:MAG: hypothetical protein B7X07_03695 [Actinobacteria bacterium 21-64-8]
MPFANRHAPDWIILTIACLAQFMVVLDVSIVNVALPTMGRDLHFTATNAQWVVNAYVLTFAGFLLLGGRAADLFGRRHVYLAGMVVFTLASVGAGFATSDSQIVAIRALQGIGGAILSPARVASSRGGSRGVGFSLSTSPLVSPPEWPPCSFYERCAAPTPPRNSTSPVRFWSPVDSRRLFTLSSRPRAPVGPRRPPSSGSSAARRCWSASSIGRPALPHTRSYPFASFGRAHFRQPTS